MASNNNAVFTQEFNFKKKVKLRTQEELDQVENQLPTGENSREKIQDDQQNNSSDYATS